MIPVNRIPCSKLSTVLLALVTLLMVLQGAAANRAWGAGEPQLVFEAEGTAHVKNNNFVRGRAMAVEYAFQNALEMALKDILGDRTFKRKARGLKPMLIRPKKYIKRYRFLEFYDSEIEQFSRVKLEVVFYPEAINRDLSSMGILASLVKPNTALVLISEKSLSAEVAPDFWEHVPISEVAMLQKFLAGGVKIITREKLSEIVEEGVVFEAIQGDLDAAVDIGLKAKVDIVIVGTAVTTRLGEKNAQGMTRIQANLTLRAISTTQSTVIAARSDFATVEAMDEFKGELEAFEVVGKKMADFFLDTMRRFWEPKPEPEAGAESQVESGTGLKPDGEVPEDSIPGETSPPPSGSTPGAMEDL